MTTSPTPLPPELVAKATQAIRALPMWGETIYTADHLARVALLAADVPGLLTERDSAVHVAEILAVNLKQEEVECDRLRGSIAVEKRWRKDADEQRDEARAALAVALHIIGDADKILTDEYGDYGPLAKRVTDVKEHARRVLGGGGRVTNLEKTLESDSDTLRNEIARLLVQTEAQRNAIDGLRAAKAELARQVEDLREELSELADAGIEKVLALEAELATLRKSRNHYLNAWLSEQLEDLRPTLSALSEAIEARRMRDPRYRARNISCAEEWKCHIHQAPATAERNQRGSDER